MSTSKDLKIDYLQNSDQEFPIILSEYKINDSTMIFKFDFTGIDKVIA